MKNSTGNVLLMGLLIALNVFGCSGTNELSQFCDANDLLLGESFFPAGATVDAFISPLPEGTKDSVGTTVYLGQGIVVQNVFPFSTTRSAKTQYEDDLRDPVFTPRRPDQGWLAPDGIVDFSFEVENYRIVCGIQNNIPMCRAILQHGSYYVYLNAHTYENEFSHMDFLMVVEEIGKRMQNCVSSVN